MKINGSVVKTDKISARKIADYLIAYAEVPNYNQEDPSI